ncbi:hypothetical protein JRQ81_007162 [Phrynocephalus forsythii]|uniref:Uncharacterized protein n=1 Tax=Phrynocephalus forsythii TaxID=171643 RepID=A0A9Q0XD79_9SAUR|nr:hypothetical protein JRQ81_007162 [Phrynocephalus forsythii]
MGLEHLPLLTSSPFFSSQHLWGRRRIAQGKGSARPSWRTGGPRHGTTGVVVVVVLRNHQGKRKKTKHLSLVDKDERLLEALSEGGEKPSNLWVSPCDDNDTLANPVQL